MAVKISELPAAGAAAGTDQLEANQGGTSRRLTVAQVATHVRSTATDTVVVAAGSAAAPSIAPTGDSNTGIFFPAADTIAFSEGGVEALRLDSSGNATFAGTAAMASSFLRNKLINGAAEIAQRGTSAVSNSGFPVDRFLIFAEGGSTGVFSAQQSSVAPAGFQNSIVLTTTTADTSLGASEGYSLQQRVEGFNIVDLAWGTASARSVTLSFWARSSLTGTFAGSITNGSFNRAYVFTYSLPTANTWTYVTVTIPGDTGGTWATTSGTGLIVYWNIGAGSNLTVTANVWGSFGYNAASTVSLIGTNSATLYLTGVQLEVGSAATPFERRQFGHELFLCQRYYAAQSAAQLSRAYNYSSITLDVWHFVCLPATMRVAPTVTAVLDVNDGPNVSPNFISSSTTSFGLTRYGLASIAFLDLNSWTASAEL